MAAGNSPHFAIKEVIPALVIISIIAPLLSNLIAHRIIKPLKEIEAIVQMFNDGKAITLSNSNLNRIKEFSNLGDFIINSLNLKKNEQNALADAAAAHAEKARIETQTREAVMVFAGSIAHDLRTPLAILNMRSHTLKKILPDLLDTCEYAKKTTHQQHDDLKNIPKEFIKTIAEMQLFISETLKVLGRVISGDLMKNDLVMCDSWSCISNSLQHYSFEKNTKRELINWDQSYRFSFLGNQILFTRILFNLLENSFYQIHKNNRGDIFISTEDGGNVNMLRFRDTAGEIPLDFAASLFKSYQTTKENGSGVGLSFCKLTMQSFGGDITCRITDEGYLEFMLTFPKV